MDQTNLVVHQSNQISAIKKNISGVKLQEFVFQLLGTATVPTTAMIILMKKIVDRFHVPTTSTSAKTRNVFSKLTFAMAKTIVVTIPTNLTNMLVWHHHSAVPSVSGNVQELLHAAST
jgi:hypothetical protein